MHGSPAICTLIDWVKSSHLFKSLSGFCEHSISRMPGKKSIIFYKEVTHHKLKVLQLRVSEMFNSTNQNKEAKVIDQSKVRTI